MAKKRIPQFLGLDQSIFRPRKARKRGPNRLSPLLADDAATTPLRAVNSEFCGYVMMRCARARIASDVTMIKAASIMSGRPMAESVAWQWFLDEFLRDRPQFQAPKYAEAVRMGELRIIGMRSYENKQIIKQRLDREASDARAQYVEERKANGGDTALFDSNRWQRLRYEVLVESKGCCVLCGRSQREHGIILHVDHIKPRSRFPNLSLVKSNLQVLCEDCNLGKGNRDTIDWRPANDEDREQVA